MIRLYCGEDTYESYRAGKARAEALAFPAGSQPLVLEADEISTPDFMNHLQGVGLFQQVNIVFAKRLFYNKQLVAYISDNFQTVSNSEVVIWHDGKVDQRLGLAKQLKQSKAVKQFDTIPAWELERWVEGELTLKGVKLSRAGVSRLTERTGNSKWLLSSEIDKLSLYYCSAQRELTVEDVDATVGIEAKGDIWRFLDYLGAGNKAAALLELEKMMQFEEDEQYLIAMLSRELGTIARVLQARAQNIDPKQLGLHPFVLGKAVEKSKRFSWETIKKLTYALLRLDLSIKQGKIEPQHGFLLYLLSW